MCGDPAQYAKDCYKMVTMWYAMADERTEAHSFLTEEERQLVKPMASSFQFFGGDAIWRMPGFDSSYAGENGDFLLECWKSYNYDTHHNYVASIYSADMCFAICGTDWVLGLQYGRVSDALSILRARLGIL